MSDQTPYISKDADRLGVITASASVFFFILSWILYGTMQVTGDTDNDWRPMGYATMSAIARNRLCKNLFCSRRTLYESGSDSGPDDEEFSTETVEPEDEDGSVNPKFE
jgi:hypothetical protein